MGIWNSGQDGVPIPYYSYTYDPQQYSQTITFTPPGSLQAGAQQAIWIDQNGTGLGSNAIFTDVFAEVKPKPITNFSKWLENKYNTV